MNHLNLEQEIALIRSNICDYIDTYKDVKGTITASKTLAQGPAPNNRNKIGLNLLIAEVK